MKKTKVMRLLSLLLVMTLISTCAISGTFAKYVTRASGEDQARVAKWGVLVSIEGSTFATKYEATDEAYLEDGGEFSVVASNEDQVVAPGTSSEQVGDTLVATVKGQPEVAARYILEGTTVSDVVLAKGTYTDYTELVKAEDGTYGYTGEFTLEKNYAPIKWDLAISKNDGEPVSLAKLLYENLPAANLAQAEAYGLTEDGCSVFDAIVIIQKVAGNEGYKNIVESALGQVVSGGRNFELSYDEDTGAFKLSYDFDPNKEMNFKFELTWSWAFSDAEEETEITLNDKADTFLGNWAAVELGQEIEGFEAPAAPSSIRISATLTATAVQID